MSSLLSPESPETGPAPMGPPRRPDVPGIKKGSLSVNALDLEVGDLLEVKKNEDIAGIEGVVRGQVFQVISLHEGLVMLRETTSVTGASFPEGESIDVDQNKITPMSYRKIGKYDPYFSPKK